MARPRKGPWRRKSDGCWYTTETGGKKLIKLADSDATYEEAFDIFCQYHGEVVKKPQGPLITVSFLIDEYLEWVSANRAYRTYKWYRDYLEKFHKFHGPKLLANRLQPYQVEKWVLADYKNCSAATKRGACRSIIRVMNWAKKSGLIKYNPLAGMETPTATPRETVITDKQFSELLKHVKGDCFKDYLIFMWETGCRANETRIVEAKHFDGEKIILEKLNSKGKKYNRVVYLTDKSLEIIKRLIAKNSKGPIFRNRYGKPWTTNSIVCRFKRLKEKINVPELCATTLRHSWATRCLKNGMDSTTASILMGHRDPSTLQRNYQHLIQDHEYLKKAMKKTTKDDGSL